MARRKKLKEVRIGVFGLERVRGFVKNLQEIKGVKLVAVCEKSIDWLFKVKSCKEKALA